MSFLTRAFHAWIDCPIALLLVVAPFLLVLTIPIAIDLSVVTGIAAFILTVLTDYDTGLFKVIPYKLHMIVDGIVGATFVIAPFILGFQGGDGVFLGAACDRPRRQRRSQGGNNSRCVISPCFPHRGGARQNGQDASSRITSPVIGCSNLSPSACSIMRGH